MNEIKAYSKEIELIPLRNVCIEYVLNSVKALKYKIWIIVKTGKKCFKNIIPKTFLGVLKCFSLEYISFPVVQIIQNT